MMICGTLDYAHIDTTPGVTGERAVFAPPVDFTGDDKDYLTWLRSRLDNLQWMAWTRSRPGHDIPLEVYGPYAEAFKLALGKVIAKTKVVSRAP